MKKFTLTLKQHLAHLTFESKMIKSKDTFLFHRERRIYPQTTSTLKALLGASAWPTHTKQAKFSTSTRLTGGNSPPSSIIDS
jgi:hypothetical protein